MNTKLIHYDQCYYNEHKINSSQRNAQSTTHLLYLLTKNNRTIILHQGDTRGHGHRQHVSHTQVFLFLEVYQDIFARRHFIYHSKWSQSLGNLHYQWFSWPLLLPPSAGSGMRQMKPLGALGKETCMLGSCKHWGPLAWSWFWALCPYTGYKPRP